MKKLKLSSARNGRVFRSGLYSTAILAVAVVLAVLVNLLVRALPSKYTEFDLSAGKLYTLGDSSVQLAQSLEQDVTIYYLCETGSEDTIISKLLDRYASQSSHITWEQKDPTLYPTFASQYGAENSSSGSLIFVSGGSSLVLDAADLYEYDYSNYYYTGSYDVTFAGESQISSAIYRLTSGEQSHVYYTTNHSEQSLTSSLTKALTAQNIEVSALDLLSSEIPEDCDLLIINAPATDFAAEDGVVDEMAQLRTYLEKGGKLLLTTDPSYETPNLDALMAEFGLSRQPGVVVEGDADHALYNSPYALLPDYASTTNSTALDGVDTSNHVIMILAQGITITEQDDVTAEALLNATDEAYLKSIDSLNAGTYTKENGDTEGPFALAVWARDDNTDAEVIWIADGNMDNEQLYQSVPGNLTFLQGCAASLTGQSDGLLIDTKIMEADPITVSASAGRVLALVFVLILPAAILIAGAAVVLLRRRK